MSQQLPFNTAFSNYQKLQLIGKLIPVLVLIKSKMVVTNFLLYVGGLRMSLVGPTFFLP